MCRRILRLPIVSQEVCRFWGMCRFSSIFGNLPQIARIAQILAELVGASLLGCAWRKRSIRESSLQLPQRGRVGRGRRRPFLWRGRGERPRGPAFSNGVSTVTSPIARNSYFCPWTMMPVCSCRRMPMCLSETASAVPTRCATNTSPVWHLAQPFVGEYP